MASEDKNQMRLDSIGFLFKGNFSGVNVDAFHSFDDPHGIYRRTTDNPSTLQ